MGILHREVIYPAILRGRGESAMYAELERLRGLQRDTPETMRKRQLVALADILDYSADHSPFYAGRLGDRSADALGRLRRAPVLTKEAVQQEFDRLSASPAPRRVHRKTTGGSTGQPVTILKDAGAIAAERATTWLAHEWFGLRIGDRGARFWGSPRGVGRRRMRFTVADLAMNRIRLSAFGVTDEVLAKHWSRCLAFRPRYLYGYVSMLERFARYVRDRGFDGTLLGVRCIVTTSETLMESQRELLASVFGAPIQNEYGCGEVGPIAYECGQGMLHVMSESVLVELLGDDGLEVDPGVEGTVVVTDLRNRAMPLIRYRLEDRAVRGRVCACGRGFPVLAAIRGRKYDFVETPDGRSFHGEFFMYLFEDLRDAGLPIGIFRVVQDSPDHLKIEVQAPASSVASIVSAVRERLSKELGMQIAVQVVDVVELSRSGKLRVIENRLLSGVVS